jgi:hypothetical protein
VTGVVPGVVGEPEPGANGFVVAADVDAAAEEALDFFDEELELPEQPAATRPAKSVNVSARRVMESSGIHLLSNRRAGFFGALARP